MLKKILVTVLCLLAAVCNAEIYVGGVEIMRVAVTNEFRNGINITEATP